MQGRAGWTWFADSLRGLAVPEQATAAADYFGRPFRPFPSNLVQAHAYNQSKFLKTQLMVM